VHLVRVPPGKRTSYPHAESAGEEFVYVIEGRSMPGSTANSTA